MSSGEKTENIGPKNIQMFDTLILTIRERKTTKWFLKRKRESATHIHTTHLITTKHWKYTKNDGKKHYENNNKKIYTLYLINF